MAHPDYLLPAEHRPDEIPAFEAVYPASGDLHARTVRKLALEALERAPGACRVAGASLAGAAALARLARGAGDAARAAIGRRRRAGGPGAPAPGLRRAVRAPTCARPAQGRAQVRAGPADRRECADGRGRSRPPLPAHRRPGAQPGRNPRRRRIGRAHDPAAARRCRRRQDRRRHARHGGRGGGGAAVGADGAHRDSGSSALRDHCRAAGGAKPAHCAAHRP